MSQYTFKMPDLGEGTVDAEIVAWHTKPGDVVTEDQLIVEVMTDKAAVEVPAPVSGRVVSVTGVPGDKVAVGSPLIVFELSDGAARRRICAAAPAAQANDKVAMPQPAVDDSAAAPGCIGRSPGPGDGLARQSASCARGGYRSRHRHGLGSRAAASCAAISKRGVAGAGPHAGVAARCPKTQRKSR